MIDQIEKYIQLSDQKDELLVEIRYNYFQYILPFFRWYGLSDSYKANKDLQAIKKKIARKEKQPIKIKSIMINSFMNHPSYDYKIEIESLLKKQSLTLEEEQILVRELLSKLEYVEESAFIITLLEKQNNNSYYKWFVTLLISVLGIVIAN